MPPSPSLTDIKFIRSKQIIKYFAGSDFDIRDFHSVVLKNGPVPLNVLENIVTDWINSVKRGPANHVTSQPVSANVNQNLGRPHFFIPNIIG